MSKGTGIQWADDTVNPTSGCDGCELWIPGQGGPCYAGNLHETRLSKSLPLLYDSNFNNVRTIHGRVTKSLRCMSLVSRNRPDKPWLNGLRRKIFVGDLGDIFSAGIPFDFLLNEVFTPAVNSPHDLLLLTKQPQRAVQFASWLPIEWPENIWIGTSITSKASKSRIQHLSKIPAKFRFLSIEPLVQDPELTVTTVKGSIQWMIIGGESNQGQYTARPFSPKWAEDVIELGKVTDTAVFVKQMGSNSGLNLNDTHGGDWSEWPEHLRVRQMPFGCS